MKEDSSALSVCPSSDLCGIEKWSRDPGNDQGWAVNASQRPLHNVLTDHHAEESRHYPHRTSSVNETLYGAFTNPLNDTSKIVEVRVAYFALCVLTSARNWICDSNASNLGQSLRADNQTDPLNLLWIGEKFQSEAITSAFM
ncbi:hypothetical protein AUP68_08085 [Ilyonectria robusta]